MKPEMKKLYDESEALEERLMSIPDDKYTGSKDRDEIGRIRIKLKNLNKAIKKMGGFGTGYEDGGLAMAIKKVKAKEMKDGGGVKMGPKIPAKIKDPVKVKPIPKKIIKKLVGFKEGGEAVPSKFKGFSKLPEEVQKKMDPALAERFEDGGPVKMGSGGGVCKGMGIARAGGKFKVR